MIGGLESTFSRNGKSYDVDPGSRISLVPCFGVILVDNICAYYTDSLPSILCHRTVKYHNFIVEPVNDGRGAIKSNYSF